jgi:multiple sugar transport system permease protein
MGIWRGLGFDMVIYVAGLQGIDRSFYEAAMIDGANRWQVFRFVTWPLLWPTTFFMLVIGVIGSFQVFEPVFIMTQGGPVNATLVLVYYLWLLGFREMVFGYASAIAVALFALMLVFTLLQFRALGSRAEYG